MNGIAIAPSPATSPASPQLLHAIIEASPEGTLVIDRRGTVVYMNAAAETLLGRTREDLRGDEFGVPSVADTTTEICVPRDGELTFIELNVRSLPDFGDGVSVITLQNVTQYRTDREEALQDAERLSRFLAVLSHEIRNPIGALQSAFEVMQFTSKADPDYGQAEEVAGEQFHQIRRLLGDLLDLSRVKQDKLRLQREPVDMGELVRSVAAATRPAATAASHDLQTSVDAAHIIIDGDASRLSQVLSNLLNNAIRYTPAGGTIELSLSADDEYAHVCVADTGPGMPPGLMKTAFEPFVQADTSLDRSDSGLGIGLALVKRLVDLHEGHVRVENRASGGCQFVVSIPRALTANASPPLKRPVDAAASDRAAAKRIVLAEDNTDLRFMMRLLLQRFGYEVSDYADGPEALDAILDGTPDAAILDIGLPGLSGYRVAEAVRRAETDGRMPLVALTGYGRGEDRAEAIAAGFDEHVTKPPDFEALRDTLQRLIRTPR